MLNTFYHTNKYTSAGDVSVCLHTAVSPEAAETRLLQKQWKGKACCSRQNPEQSRPAQQSAIYSISYYSRAKTHVTCALTTPLLLAGTQLICWASHKVSMGEREVPT